MKLSKEFVTSHLMEMANCRRSDNTPRDFRKHLRKGVKIARMARADSEVQAAIHRAFRTLVQRDRTSDERYVSDVVKVGTAIIVESRTSVGREFKVWSIAKKIKK